MGTAKTAGRMVGVLVLAQMPAGYVLNFVLLAPLAAAAGGFLVNAAAHPLQIGAAPLLGLATGAMTVGIAIAAWPILRRGSEAMALWLLALAVVELSLVAVEGVGVMCLLSLSEAYAKATAADAGLFLAVATLARSVRNWAHYTQLIAAGSTLLVLYAVLFRFALVPRLLAALGLVGVALQLTAVSLPLFGVGIMFPLLMPLGLSQLVLGLWLVVRGFDDRRLASP